MCLFLYSEMNYFPIPCMVSGGRITKQALTLAQCVEQHISGNTNKTTLGLAVTTSELYQRWVKALYT